MRKRDLRTGLILEFNGCRGVTNWHNGELVMECHSVWGPEGYHSIKDIIELGGLRYLKLVGRVYNPHER